MTGPKTSAAVQLDLEPPSSNLVMIGGSPGPIRSDLLSEGAGFYLYATAAAVLFPAPNGRVSFAAAPPEPLIGKSILLDCSDEAFVVVSPLQQVRFDPNPTVFVYNRANSTWSTLSMHGMARLRIFEDWLAIAVQNASSAPSQEFPSGSLLIRNLTDNREIRLPVEGQDNEVLLIVRSQILYRSADKIFLARIQGGELFDNTLLVEDSEVARIHWAVMTDTQ